MHNKGPKDDAQRVNYDLSVVISHVPDYLKAKAKREAEEAERQARMQERVKVNYKNLSYTQIQVDGLDDISALLDEI